MELWHIESHDYRGNVQCLDHHADRQEGGARVALLCWLRNALREKNSSSYTWMKLFLYVNILICILYPQCGPETRLKKLLGGKKWFLPPPGHEQEKCVMLMMRQLLMKAPTYHCAPNKGHVQHTDEDQHKDHPTELCCFWRSRPRISVHMGQDLGSFEKNTARTCFCPSAVVLPARASFSSGTESLVLGLTVQRTLVDDFAWAHDILMQV